MFIRNKRGPNTILCFAHVTLFCNGEVWEFKTIFRWRPDKKFSHNFRILPSTPCGFNLKIKPLYQTDFRKVLEISRNVSQTSIRGLQSNLFFNQSNQTNQIPCVIDNNCVTHSSPGIKFD